VANGRPKRLDSARGLFVQQCFDFGESILDGVEVWAVGRELTKLGSSGSDDLLRARSFMAREIVHHHDVAWAQLRDQDLLDPSFKHAAVYGPFDHERRHDAGVAQACDHGGGLPMAVRDTHPQAFVKQRKKASREQRPKVSSLSG
jgi:hypothetical protein